MQTKLACNANLELMQIQVVSPGGLKLEPIFNFLIFISTEFACIVAGEINQVII